jgi:hypothetical protein
MAELTGPQPKEKSGSLIKPTGERAARKQVVSARHGVAAELSEEHSSLLQRAAVRPTGSSSSAAVPAATGSRFAHDLSQVPTHTETPGTGPGVRAKLTISTPGDRFEQEADRVADQVMSMPTATDLAGAESQNEGSVAGKPLVQRQSDSVPQVSDKLEGWLASRRGSGRPLEDRDRSFTESRFGADLSAVRVHTDMDAVIQRDVTVIHVPQEEAIRIGHTSGREVPPHHDQNLASIERGLRGGLRSFDNSTLVREAERRNDRLQHPPSPIGPCTRRAIAESLVLIYDLLEARIRAAPTDFQRLRPDVEGLEWSEGDPLAGELWAIRPFHLIEDWRAMASDESECPVRRPRRRRRRPPPPTGEFAEIQTANFEPIVQNQVLWSSVRTGRFNTRVSEIMMRQVPRLCQQLNIPSDLRPGQVSPAFLTRLSDEIQTEGQNPALRLNDESVVNITISARLRYDPDMEPGREVAFQLRGVQIRRLGDDPSPREIGSLHLYLASGTFAHWFATRYRQTLMAGQADPTNFYPVRRSAQPEFPLPQPCFGQPNTRERMEFAEVLRTGELTYGTNDFAFFRRQRSAFQQYIRLWSWNWSDAAAGGDQGERRWDFLSEPQFIRFRTALFSIRRHNALDEFTVPPCVPSHWGQPR